MYCSILCKFELLGTIIAFNKYMKKLLFISFCMTLSILAFAQNNEEPIFCTELVRQLPNDETEVIRLTNKSEIRINDVSTGDLYQLAFVKDTESYTMIIKSLKAHCFDNKTPVTLYFRNGTKIQLDSTNKDNCKSLLTVDLGQAQKENKIQAHLLDQYLIGIQYNGKEDGSIKLKVGTPQNEMIQELFECISK